MIGTRQSGEKKAIINCVPRHLAISKVQVNGKVLAETQRKEVFSQPPSQSSLQLAKDPDHYHTIGLMPPMQPAVYVIAEQISRHAHSNIGVLLLTPETPEDNFTYKVVKEFPFQGEKCDLAENEYSALLKYKKTGIALIKHPPTDPKFALVISDYEPGYMLTQLMYKRNQPNTLQSSWPDLQWLRLAIQVIETGIELEDAGILQYDFSPSNLIYNILTQKLSAIDFANTLAIEKKTDQVTTQESCYTDAYIAPEVATQYSKFSLPYSYTLAAPTYVLGVIAQEIALNQHLRWDQNCCRCNFVSSTRSYVELAAHRSAFSGSEQAKGTREKLLLVFEKLQHPDTEKRISLRDARDELVKLCEAYAKTHPHEDSQIKDCISAAQIKEDMRLKAFAEAKNVDGEGKTAKAKHAIHLLKKIARPERHIVGIKPQLEDSLVQEAIEALKLSRAENRDQEVTRYWLLALTYIKKTKQKAIVQALLNAGWTKDDIKDKEFYFYYSFYMWELDDTQVVLENLDAYFKFDTASFLTTDQDDQARLLRLKACHKLYRNPQLIVAEAPYLLTTSQRANHKDYDAIVSAYCWALCAIDQDEKAMQVAGEHRDFQIKNLSDMLRQLCANKRKESEEDKKDDRYLNRIFTFFEALTKECRETLNSHYYVAYNVFDTFLFDQISKKKMNIPSDVIIRYAKLTSRFSPVSDTYSNYFKWLKRSNTPLRTYYKFYFTYLQSHPDMWSKDEQVEFDTLLVTPELTDEERQEITEMSAEIAVTMAVIEKKYQAAIKRSSWEKVERIILQRAVTSCDHDYRQFISWLHSGFCHHASPSHAMSAVVAVVKDTSELQLCQLAIWHKFKTNAADFDAHAELLATYSHTPNYSILVAAFCWSYTTRGKAEDGIALAKKHQPSLNDNLVAMNMQLIADESFLKQESTMITLLSALKEAYTYVTNPNFLKVQDSLLNCNEPSKRQIVMRILTQVAACNTDYFMSQDQPKLQLSQHDINLAENKKAIFRSNQVIYNMLNSKHSPAEKPPQIPLKQSVAGVDGVALQDEKLYDESLHEENLMQLIERMNHPAQNWDTIAAALTRNDPLSHAVRIDFFWRSNNLEKWAEALQLGKSLLENADQTTGLLHDHEKKPILSEKIDVFYIKNRLGYLACECKDYTAAMDYFNSVLSNDEIDRVEYVLAKFGKVYVQLLQDKEHGPSVETAINEAYDAFNEGDDEEKMQWLPDFCQAKLCQLLTTYGDKKLISLLSSSPTTNDKKNSFYCTDYPLFSQPGQVIDTCLNPSLMESLSCRI